jgi:hypothetical protein
VYYSPSVSMSVNYKLLKFQLSTRLEVVSDVCWPIYHVLRKCSCFEAIPLGIDTYKWTVLISQNPLISPLMVFLQITFLIQCLDLYNCCSSQPSSTIHKRMLDKYYEIYLQLNNLVQYLTDYLTTLSLSRLYSVDDI